MRHCYVCDGDMPGASHRRTVRTGSSSRVSVGRRVSTSSGESRGLRTVCQVCADGIDTQERLAAAKTLSGVRAFGIGATVVVGLIIYASSHGSHPSVPLQESFIIPAQAAATSSSSMITPTGASSRPRSQAVTNGYMPSDTTPSNRGQPTAPIVSALNASPI